MTKPSYFDGAALFDAPAERPQVLRALGLDAGRGVWLATQCQGRTEAILRATDDGTEVHWQGGGTVPVELLREVGRACADPHPHPHVPLPIHAPSNNAVSAWLEDTSGRGIRLMATNGADEREIAPPHQATRLGRFAFNREAFVFHGVREGELGLACAFLQEGEWIVRPLPNARWAAWSGDELVVALPLPTPPLGRLLVQVCGLLTDSLMSGGDGEPSVILRAMDKVMIWDPHAAAVAVVLPADARSTTRVFKTSRLDQTAELTWHYRMSTERYHRGCLVTARRNGAGARVPTSIFAHRDDAPFGGEIAVGETPMPELRCSREGLMIIRRSGLETDLTVVWSTEHFTRSNDPFRLPVLGGEGTCPALGLLY